MNVRKFVLTEIDKNPFQVRSGVDPVYVAELAEDIERNGLLQTPVGRLVEGRVQLAFGHNRLRAFGLLAERFSEFEQMPVEIRDLNDEQMALLAWSENEVRQQLNPVERAKAVEQMIAAFGWSQQEAGDRLGMARSTVANMLRLLKLPQHVLENLAGGRLSVRQATALLPVYELGEEDLGWIYSNLMRKDFIRDAIMGQISSDMIRFRVEEFMGALERRKERAAEESEKKDFSPSPSPAQQTELMGEGGKEARIVGSKTIRDDPEKTKLRMLLTPAIDYVRTQQFVTVPQLQRELRVSWRTAHDLVQEMRKWDVLGDMDGSSMRHKVLVGRYAQEVEPEEDEPAVEPEEDEPAVEPEEDEPADEEAEEEEAGGLVKDQLLQEAEELPSQSGLTVEISWSSDEVQIFVEVERDGVTNTMMRMFDSLTLDQVSQTLSMTIPEEWKEVIG